jgi:short-subunit dehydrogenase
VLVTGATGGLGQAIARAFSARGAEVTLTGRRLDLLGELAAELGARAIQCDLSVPAEVDRLIAEAGEVDVLVANAALPGSGHLVDLTQRQIDAVIEVNLRAPIALARGLAPGMIERRRGHLVFISSLSGKAAAPLSSIYNATKFGLRGFSLSVREDLRSDGVGVSVILPGFISGAGLFADADVELPHGVGTRTPEQVAQATIRAVERNQAEVHVSPLPLRVGADFASAAPAVAATITRLLGGERIARAHAEGQRRKRPEP